MGFLEAFSLALILIAFGTVMALFWRVLNKIFRAIEHHHDDDKHLEDEESSDEEDEEQRKGFSAPFWDFLIYLGFLATFVAVVYALRGGVSAPYDMHLGLEDWFTGNEFHYNVPFSGLNLRDQVYTWLSAVVVPGVLPIVRNDGSGIELGCVDRLTLGDGQSLRVGAIRLRKISSQFKVKVTDYLEDDKGAWKREYLPRVYSDYVGPGIMGCSSSALTNENHSDFRSTTVRGDVPRTLPGYEKAPHRTCPPTAAPATVNGTAAPTSVPSPSPTRPPTVKVPTAPKMGGYSIKWRNTDEPAYKSKITGNYYCSNGQVWDLSTNQTTALAELEMLRDDDWLIDDGTRALLTEFVLYNPGTALFGLFRGVVEFHPAGAVVPTFDILAVDLAGTTIAWKNDGAKMDQRICAYLEVMLYLQVLCYIVLEIKAIKQLGWHTYRKQYISLLTCINLLSFLVALCYRLINLKWVFGNYRDILRTVDHDEYPEELAKQIVVYKTVDQLNAVNAILSFFRLFKYLRANPGLAQLSDTIYLATMELGPVMLILIVCMVAYAAALQIAFGQELFDYSNMPNAMQSMTRAIVGDFDFTVLMGPGRAVTNNTIGMCLCVSYVVVTQFVVLSMLLAILDHAYEDVREELQHKVIDEDTKHFNEDFAWVVRSPVTGLDYLMRQVVQFSSGTSVDFGKLRERRRVDPAMLHVLKFEKMATGTDHDATAEQAKIKAEREAAIARAKARRAMHEHCRDTLRHAIAQLDECIDTQNESARALGVAKVKKYEPPEEEEDG
mmetsp:Transcript_26206/g.68063  ORF Transcript_26206/g.68063 Transcript_26206/m.68063 type:complete len:779 (-) Transcript_26206:9-2345(-)